MAGQLEHTDHRVRWDAVETLRRIGPAALDAVAVRLDHEEWTVRAAADCAGTHTENSSRKAVAYSREGGEALSVF